MNERQYFHIVMTLGNERTTIFSYTYDLGQWTNDNIFILWWPWAMNERQYFHIVMTLGNERTTIFSYYDDLGQWTNDNIFI